jgi:hypothetical protein
MAWLMPHAISDVSRDHLTSLWEPATTALLGRVNAEGFLGFWPTVLDMPEADERDRAYARWLVEAEKGVLSTTLTEAPWGRSRIVNAPAAEVADELKFGRQVGRRARPGVVGDAQAQPHRRPPFARYAGCAPLASWPLRLAASTLRASGVSW